MFDLLEHMLTPLRTDGGMYLHIGGVVLVSFITSVIFPWIDRRIIELLKTVRTVLGFLRRR